MRKLSPAIIATAVAMAFATTATAQRIGVTSATGTNGSTVTTSTSSAATAAGTTSSGTTGTNRTNPSLEPRAQVQTPPAGSEPVSSGPAFNRSEDRRPPTDTTTASGFATTTNDVTANNGNAAPVGSALGTSAGQTSAGTAGARSAGAGVTGITSPNLGLSGTTVASAQGTIVNANGSAVNGVDGGTLTGNFIVPGAGFAGGGFTGGMGDPSGVNANGERVGSGGADFRAASNVVVAPAPAPTPIFNQAAARGAARDAARRARGDEPRIIGLAPRTDRDLSHQMPDDPIIRY